MYTYIHDYYTMTFSRLLKMYMYEVECTLDCRITGWHTFSSLMGGQSQCIHESQLSLEKMYFFLGF